MSLNGVQFDYNKLSCLVLSITRHDDCLQITYFIITSAASQDSDRPETLCTNRMGPEKPFTVYRVSKFKLEPKLLTWQFWRFGLVKRPSSFFLPMLTLQSRYLSFYWLDSNQILYTAPIYHFLRPFLESIKFFEFFMTFGTF